MLADLVAFLGNASAISALVGLRIYPQELPQKPTLPALTYNQISAVRVRELAGPAGKARRRIQIDCWASTYKGAHALADAVRQTLEPFYGSMANTEVGSIMLDNEFDLFEEEAGVTGIYRVMQDYLIAHLED